MVLDEHRRPSKDSSQPSFPFPLTLQQKAECDRIIQQLKLPTLPHAVIRAAEAAAVMQRGSAFQGGKSLDFFFGPKFRLRNGRMRGVTRQLLWDLIAKKESQKTWKELLRRNADGSFRYPAILMNPTLAVEVINDRLSQRGEGTRWIDSEKEVEVDRKFFAGLLEFYKNLATPSVPLGYPVDVNNSHQDIAIYALFLRVFKRGLHIEMEKRKNSTSELNILGTRFSTSEALLTEIKRLGLRAIQIEASTLNSSGYFIGSAADEKFRLLDKIRRLKDEISHKPYIIERKRTNVLIKVATISVVFDLNLCFGMNMPTIAASIVNVLLPEAKLDKGKLRKLIRQHEPALLPNTAFD